MAHQKNKNNKPNMRSFLILLMLLFFSSSSELSACDSSHYEDQNYLSSLVPALVYTPPSCYLNDADALFTEAHNYQSSEPLKAAEIYAQAGALYHWNIYEWGNAAPRSLYQSAILSSFRAGFYMQDNDRNGAQSYFSYCYNTMSAYLRLFETEISVPDIHVCIMIFNKIASFFEKSEHSSDKQNAADFYIKAGNLGMIAFNKLQVTDKATPLDYEKPAIAYYNAAYTLKDINPALSSPFYQYSAKLHLSRTQYKGNHATENDLRMTSRALYCLVFWNDSLSADQKFSIYRIVLNLELRRFELLGPAAIAQDYDIIAKAYYNLGTLCSNAFARILQLQYYQKAAEFESIYLIQKNFHVPDQELLDAHLIYQEAAETMQLYDQAQAQIFYNQAQLIQSLLNQR